MVEDPGGLPIVPVEQEPLQVSRKEHGILFGPQGLRAGWGILLFLILMSLFSYSLRFGLRGLEARHPAEARQAMKEPPPYAVILNDGILFVSVGLASWVMSRIERRPAGVYGLGGSRSVPHFAAGSIWGLVFLSLLVLLLWRAGLTVFDGRLLFGMDAVRYAFEWAIAFLLVGLFEEYFLRGYLQYTLSRGLSGLYGMASATARYRNAFGFWTAALILSFVFGLGHSSNKGESPLGMFAAGVAGLVFCFSLWRTGSLWWAVGMHAAWDWAQSFLYGVPDSGLIMRYHLLASHPVGSAVLSGGATGPEGSVYVLPIFGLMAAVIFGTLKQQSRPMVARDGAEQHSSDEAAV